MKLEKLLKPISNEFVGIWKFKTLSKGTKWCASVNVSGKLIDTEDYPTMKKAVKRAVKIVKKMKK